MSLSPITIDAALADATQKLAGISDSARLDAEALLASVLDAPRSHLFTHPEQALSLHDTQAFDEAVRRRAGGEPVAYITGRKEFWSLRLKVTADTLVPRPETEILVEQALAAIPRDSPCRILELGTGSGAIAIAIARERPDCEIVAVDASREALSVARENADQHLVETVRFVEGDWTAPVSGEHFDVVVSNPPYVAGDDPALDDLEFEPRSALVGGADGLDAIRTIANRARAVVNEGGRLFLEHGAGQRDAVASILRDNGWTDIRCFDDLSGQPRVTAATMR